MIQLDNIIKGTEVLNGQPLNEQQKIELNGHVEKLPIIEQLKDNDEQLLKGQQDIEDRLDKGAKRMDGIEGELKSLKEEFQKGIKEIITEVKDQKITDLKKDLSDRKTSDTGLKNDLIKIAVVSVLAVLGYLFIKAYG